MLKISAPIPKGPANPDPEGIKLKNFSSPKIPSPIWEKVKSFPNPKSYGKKVY